MHIRKVANAGNGERLLVKQLHSRQLVDLNLVLGHARHVLVVVAPLEHGPNLMCTWERGQDTISMADGYDSSTLTDVKAYTGVYKDTPPNVCCHIQARSNEQRLAFFESDRYTPAAWGSKGSRAACGRCGCPKCTSGGARSCRQTQSRQATT